MAESTESSTSVAAPPADVLAVIADLESYPEWAAGVKEVEVLSTRSGRPSRARFVVDNGPIKDTYVLDYTWKVTRAGTGTVSWTLVEAGIISKLDGSYEVAADPDTRDASTVTYRLGVDVRIPMLGMLKRKAEKVIIDTALSELTKRVEGSAGDRSPKRS